MGADDGRLLESLRFKMKPLYPFTVYHAASKMSRRYTLYANSEEIRKKWKDALEDTIAVHKARQEANMVRYLSLSQIFWVMSGADCGLGLGG